MVVSTLFKFVHEVTVITTAIRHERWKTRRRGAQDLGHPLARLQEAMNKIWQRKDLPLDVRLKLYDNLRRQFENLFSQSKREDEVSEGVVDEKRAIFPKTPATPTTPVTPRRRSPHRKTPIRRKSTSSSQHADHRHPKTQAFNQHVLPLCHRRGRS